MRTAKTIIGEDAAASPLLAWLSLRFTYFSSLQWEEMIMEGRLSINQQPARTDSILAAGDEVAFDPPPREEPPVDRSLAKVYEDSEFLIVEKSGNLPCHPGGAYFLHSLWGLLRDQYSVEISREFHIATRLDRETSGLVLICKTKDAARWIGKAQSQHALHKQYLALVHGLFPDTAEGIGYLLPDPNSCIKKKRLFSKDLSARDGPGTESSSTSFRALNRIYKKEGPISLVLALPVTGRTHQIRATLLSLGFPLVGDKLYGLDEKFFLKFMNDELGEEDRERLILPNQALHCYSLSFENSEGKTIEVSAPPRWPRSVFDFIPCEDRHL